MYKKTINSGLVFIAMTVAMCLSSFASGTGDKKTSVEDKIDSLIARMTIEEKIGQTSQRGTSSRTKALPEEIKNAVRRGEVGSLLNVMNLEHVRELQRIAVEESPNGIPLIFARDVIHGFKTIFPIPLGQAATFNPAIVKQGARIAAEEATNYGIRWTFAPMLDIARDPRWGRIAESAGEDPYLTELMAKAYVEGFQGEDLSDPSSMAACAKHFVGYGAAEGGRDYNTAIINEHQLHNVYFRPFKAAVESEAATFMTSFNELNGVPASGNNYILKKILRDAWGFKGFVVSDWNSIIEMIPHGFAKDEREAAYKAANAGLDMEMTSRSYENNLKDLMETGDFSLDQLDEMVRNILRIKFKLGLFDNPYFETNENVLYAKDHLEAAKECAVQSAVLLKNKDEILPLKNKGKIAVIGPLADAPHEQLGTWTFDGEEEKTQTALMALKSAYGDQIVYSKGLTHSRDQTTTGYEEALEAANAAEVILFFGGEEAILSGEAHSRAKINLPGGQEKLIKELAKTGKPLVLIVMAGRPITFEAILEEVDAILFAWHPGTMGGPAISDLVSGKVSPSGRLPVTWPKEVGQIPVYYNHKNTGRPASKSSFIPMDKIPIKAWQSSLGNTSHYLDAGYQPLYPFGYGLSYGKFEYDGFTISKDHLHRNEEVEIRISIKNKGDIQAIETVQLYVQDVSGSITRPIKELLQFKRVNLKKGQKKEVIFTVKTEDLSFYTLEKEWKVEDGDFKFWVAANSSDERFEAGITVDSH